MRRFFSLAMAFLLGAAVGIAGHWTWSNRDQLERRWMIYQATRAETFDAAKGPITWCETRPARDEKLAALVAHWGQGRIQFDEYLARYVCRPQCGDPLREAFSARLAESDELLDRWAHYWLWRSSLEPNEELASVARYLETLSQSTTPHTITWREVLDAQALLAIAGEYERARNLRPESWKSSGAWKLELLPRVRRPLRPFPDWKGELPGER